MCLKGVRKKGRDDARQCDNPCIAFLKTCVGSFGAQIFCTTLVIVNLSRRDRCIDYSASVQKTLRSKVTHFLLIRFLSRSCLINEPQNERVLPLLD